MAEKNRDDLKEYFEIGKKPTEQEYADLIDSFINRLDDNFAMSFDTSGNAFIHNNLGIGTANPQHRLDIPTGAGNLKTYTHGLEYTVNTNGGWARSFRFRNENDGKTAVFGSLNGAAYISAGININTDSVGHINQDITVLTNGNVGIGTTTPTEKLEVNGKIKATDINFSGLPTSSAGLDPGDVWNDAGTLKIV